jgi:hypothetical protein
VRHIGSKTLYSWNGRRKGRVILHIENGRINGTENDTKIILNFEKGKTKGTGNGVENDTTVILSTENVC